MSKKYNPQDVINTNIWFEESESDNPFAAKTCYCHGYDVYGDMLGKATWFEYLYLLFKGERPTPEQAKLLETLAVAIANPGPREASVMAAMNGGVGGSTLAACLIAALGVGAGQLGGAHEVSLAMDYWRKNHTSLSAWRDMITSPPSSDIEDVWLSIDHIPGFDPNGSTCPTPIIQTLKILSHLSDGRSLHWLKQNREALEETTGYPLSMTGVAAATFIDLNLTNDQAELLFLFLRLPGAAAHAIEQKKNGWQKFPLFKDAIEVLNDPGIINK